MQFFGQTASSYLPHPGRHTFTRRQWQPRYPSFRFPKHCRALSEDTLSSGFQAFRDLSTTYRAIWHLPEFSFSFSFSSSFQVLPLYSCLLTSASLSDRGFVKLPGKYACMHQKKNRGAGPSRGLAEWCRSGSGQTDDTLPFFLFVSNYF